MKKAIVLFTTILTATILLSPACRISISSDDNRHNSTSYFITEIGDDIDEDIFEGH